MLLVSLIACRKREEGLIDYEKAIEQFTEYDKLPPLKKQNLLNRLDTIVNSLKYEAENEPKNHKALYYYALALESQINKGKDVVNFDSVNLKNTFRISKILHKLTDVKDFTPDYKLSQYSKLTEIWGNLAVNYVIKGVPDSADYAFLEGKKQGGFTDAGLEYCRNVLNSLEPNAILFVNTNIELYNFMFIQCEENVRIDVSVVSAEMLQFYWYAKWLNFLPNLTNPVNTNCSDEYLEKIYAKNKSVSVKPNQIIKMDDTKVNVDIKGMDNSGNLTKPETVMWEIIKYNANNRSVYFNQTIAHIYSNSFGLSSNIAFEGLVFKLTANQNSIPGNEKMIQNLTQKYKYIQLKNKDSRRDRDFNYIVEEYKTAFMQAILYNSQNNQNSEAVKILIAKFDEAIPEEFNIRSNEEINIMETANRKASN